MLSNQDNTQMPGSMPGAMPGSMPGAIPENNNNTAHNALNQDTKPSIGGPHKIQSGILHHGLPVDNTDNGKHIITLLRGEIKYLTSYCTST